MRRLFFVLIFVSSVAVRFWRIDAPFDDRWSWRQSDVAAIARNYFENGFHFAHPQIDWAGNEPGFVGTEFPLLPFIAALLYKVVGLHEWIGRLLTIVIFAGSLPFVFFLVRDFFGEIAAALALIFYSFAPLSIAASRAFIPDMTSLSCALAGFYFFSRWLELRPGARARHRYFMAGAVLLALALLLKPTTGIIAAPMLALAFDKFGRKTFAQPALWLFAAVALVPSLFWYAHAVEVARQFYPHHMFGAGGVRIMNPGWYWNLGTLTFTSSLTPVLFILAVAGLFLDGKTRTPAGTRGRSTFRWWLLATILFVIVAGYGNRHEWYRLSLIPIAAALAGVATSSLARKPGGRWLVAAALLLFLCSSGVAVRRYFAPSSRAFCEAGRALGLSTAPGSLIVAADDGDPTILYYAHRKGWHFLERGGIFAGNPTNDSQLIDDLQRLHERGATHLAFYRGTNWWLDYYPRFAEYVARTATPLQTTPAYRIYKLRSEP